MKPPGLSLADWLRRMLRDLDARSLAVASAEFPDGERLRLKRCRVRYESILSKCPEMTPELEQQFVEAIEAGDQWRDSSPELVEARRIRRAENEPKSWTNQAFLDKHLPEWRETKTKLVVEQATKLGRPMTPRSVQELRKKPAY